MNRRVVQVVCRVMAKGGLGRSGSGGRAAAVAEMRGRVRLGRDHVPRWLPSCLAAGLVSASTAFASPASAQFDSVRYGGGAIISPRIGCLMWGNFTSAERTTLEAYLRGLAQLMSNQDMRFGGVEPTVRQYGVWGAWFNGTCVTDPSIPSGPADDAAIQKEVAAVQKRSVNPLLPYSPETAIMVFTKGITIPGYGNPRCAYHTAFGPKQFLGIVPFPTGPCVFGSPVDNFQEFTSHELFETATNPEALGIGWNNLQRTPDNDIADFCAGGAELTTLPNNTSGTVAKVVDNVSQTDCGIRSPSEVPPLSVVKTGTNTINVFAQHGDGSLWSITGDGTNWSSPHSLGGVISEPPSAFSADGVTIDVFARGMDGGLYRWFFDGAAWSGPFGLGGFIVGPPSAAYKAGGGKHVYVRGTDGVIYVARDGNIGNFVFTALPMPSGVQAISPPQVAKRGSDCLSIYFTGTDGHLYSSANCGDVPQPWADVGGTVLNQIGIAARAGDLSRIDVFANGPVVAGGAFPYQKTFGSSVNPFLSLGGVIVGPPSAVAVDTATIQLFARGAGGTGGSGLYQNVATDGSSWTGWGQLDTIALSAPPLAFSPDGAAIDLFMRNTAGSLVHKRFDGATWQEDQDFFFGLR